MKTTLSNARKKCEICWAWWWQGPETESGRKWEGGSLVDGSWLPRHWPSQALVSGIPTMVWALTKGQGRAGIPHPEPRGQTAAEQPRHRRHCCPSGRSHSAGGPGPLEGGSGMGQE